MIADDPVRHPLKRGTARAALAAAVLAALAACAPAATPPLPQPNPAPADTAAPASSAPSTPSQPPPSATASVTPWPENWQDLPVVPEPGQQARAIYARALALGHNPRAFAKVGDCQNVPSMFLAAFDDPRRYRLGPYQDLQETIDHFAGSFERESQAVRRGFNAASILSPFWADPEYCQAGETPLACEVRLHRPAMALISLETWWEGQPENFERYLREIVQTSIELGVLPILATKADNLEGDGAINAAIARIAEEFGIPLWNFWAAVQPLPNHGLLQDGFHLTFDLNYFDEPARLRAAWPWRNLTALQTLDSMRRSLADVTPEAP